jgi:hypothetical protein
MGVDGDPEDLLLPFAEHAQIVGAGMPRSPAGGGFGAEIAVR